MSNNNLFAVVLAAGKGTRMNSDALPKVLFPIHGRPMLSYVTDTLRGLGIEKPILIIGYLADKVKEAMGPDFDYALQQEQLGTAHAVLSAENLLKDKKGITLIVSGDQPFISADSLMQLKQAVAGGATLALLTVDTDSPNYDAFGRVIIIPAGYVQKIVEVKNATEAEKQVRLMNLGTYAVDNEWLWSALHNVKKNEVTGEYYVTDIVELAVAAGKKVSPVFIESETEALGINTPEHLAEAEKVIKP